MKAIIYHNSSCSKSRATLQLLEEKEVDTKVVNYLENPPSEKELTDILCKLKINPQELIRFKEKRAKELNIASTDERSDAEWISLMIENPILIERPIVIVADKAAIGRPIENVLNIL